MTRDDWAERWTDRVIVILSLAVIAAVAIGFVEWI
jgi:hypothetical protein